MHIRGRLLLTVTSNQVIEAQNRLVRHRIAHRLLQTALCGVVTVMFANVQSALPLPVTILGIRIVMLQSHLVIQ